ncbi:N-acetyltransferase [Actinomadura sp. KC216]|uniref:GNAT family N-acetyltransferase n=1 Tax=Actinomadura sp. KC216 TaxID=2530370 RepID=UPI001046EB2F|nr:GNAT family protein [Actinomadura sp. KC216]TDB79395.1 N-acetyltransferase [Actinomadura sp. KC216]
MGTHSATEEAEDLFLRSGERVGLRRVAAIDQEAFVDLSRRSESYFRPWILAPKTAAEFDRYVKRFDGVAAEGFVVCLLETKAMAGFVNINEIVRGPYQRGVIGYGAFVSGTGHGYMTEGLQLLLNYAFDDLGLHRVEADIQPDNHRSRKLVQRLRFRKEGFSPNFIKINGRWMDHERWAIVKEQN